MMPALMASAPPYVGGLAGHYRARAGDTRTPPQMRSAYTLVARAEEQLIEDSYSEAVRLGKEAIESFPENAPEDVQGDAHYLVAKALISQGKLEEAQHMAQMKLRSIQQKGDRNAEGKMLLCLGEISINKSLSTAIQPLTQALTIFREVQAHEMVIKALLLLCRAHWVKKNVHEALKLACKAKDTSSDLGFKSLQAEALHHMASSHAMNEAIEDCLASADEALDLYLEMKDRRMEAHELLAMASWHIQSGAPKKALTDAEDAMEIYQFLRSPRENDAVNIIFYAHMAKGDAYRARKVATSGVKRCQEGGDRRGEVQMLQLLVGLSSKEGEIAFLVDPKSLKKYEEALAYAEQALTVVRTVGDKRTETVLLNTICGLNLRLEQHDLAVMVGEECWELLQELGDAKHGATIKLHMGNVMGMSSSTMTDLLFIMTHSYIKKDQLKKAVEFATEMREYFQKQGDPKEEATALMSICCTQCLLDQWDRAVTAATSAQQLFLEAGDPNGEANALRSLMEIAWKRGDHKGAVRMAERARALFRDTSDKRGEAAVLYCLAQNALEIAVAEGARVGGTAGWSRSARDAIGKASKASELAVKTSRELLETGAPCLQLLACSLGVLAQVHMFNGSPPDALEASDEAILLFREFKDFRSEGSALLQSADALRVMRQHTEAKEAAEEAFKLCTQYDDEQGVKIATDLLDYLNQLLQPAPQQPQFQLQQQLQQQQLQQQQQQLLQQQHPDDKMPIVSIARAERGRGPALDLAAGLDLPAVKGKVLEIASRITGAEDGELEADTPLMEAGLTSNSAILLRDELANELPGIALPVTLVFDYPSIAAMAELIVQSSRRKRS